MAITFTQILIGLLIGILATFVMDLWLQIRMMIFKVPTLNYCFIGRWILHMPKGVFRHVSIAKAEQKRLECALGRISHYGIGAFFGLMLLFIASPEWLVTPTLLPALMWGIATVAAPLFLMQPAFGFGIAGSKTPNPAKTRVHSLFSHTFYGIGLYLAAWLVKLLMETTA